MLCPVGQVHPGEIKPVLCRLATMLWVTAKWMHIGTTELEERSSMFHLPELTSP